MRIPGYTIADLFCACLLLLIYVDPGPVKRRLFANPLLMRIGLIAYGVYIMHDGINALVHWAVFRRLPLHDSVASWLVTCLSLGVVYGLASFSWRYFENPLIQFSYRRRKFRRVPAQPVRNLRQPEHVGQRGTELPYPGPHAALQDPLSAEGVAAPPRLKPASPSRVLRVDIDSARAPTPRSASRSTAMRARQCMLSKRQQGKSRPGDGAAVEKRRPSENCPKEEMLDADMDDVNPECDHSQRAQGCLAEQPPLYTSRLDADQQYDSAIKAGDPRVSGHSQQPAICLHQRHCSNRRYATKTIKQVASVADPYHGGTVAQQQGE